MGRRCLRSSTSGCTPRYEANAHALSAATCMRAGAVPQALVGTWQVSIVSQEPVLFAESIYYNITFGVQDPDSVSLAQARRQVFSMQYSGSLCVVSKRLLRLACLLASLQHSMWSE